MDVRHLVERVAPSEDGKAAWVKDQNVLIENNSIIGYKVNVAITFVLEEGEQPA